MICIIEIENPVREIVKYIIESPRIQIIAIENRNRDIERVGLMKYKTRIFIVPTAILCALCTTAFAGNAVNEEKYFKVDGEPYKGITAIDVNSVLAQGATGQTSTDYYGVRAEIVQENHAAEITGLACAYKKAGSLGKFATALRNGVIGSPYFPCEVTDVFAWKRYIQESMHDPSNRVVNHSHSGVQIQTNENDQIDLESAVKNNEMIPAIGVGGVEGFIYPADYLHNDIKTPEQALEKQRQRNGRSEYINLYAKDGKTVIGKVEVTYGGTIIK